MLILKGEFLNSFFEELADWDRQLKPLKEEISKNYEEPCLGVVS